LAFSLPSLPARPNVTRHLAYGYRCNWNGAQARV
jgi:hypothetical protein